MNPILVQCDFDDTVTENNVSTLIRRAFAPDEWVRMEEEYVSGKYSVEESNIRQFPLVRADRRLIEELVRRDAGVRPGFEAFVEYCRREGIRPVIVSSGLDLYIHPVLGQLGLDGIEVYSAAAEVTADGVQVEYTGPTGARITRGFKESYVTHFRGQGNLVIYVGDGRSDIEPASRADFVIARSTLEEHLRRRKLPYYSFRDFTDVHKHVAAISRRLAARAGE